MLGAFTDVPKSTQQRLALYGEAPSSLAYAKTGEGPVVHVEAVLDPDSMNITYRCVALDTPRSESPLTGIAPNTMAQIASRLAQDARPDFSLS